MTTLNSHLNEAKVCPACKAKPALVMDVEAKEVWLNCPLHGHMAMGSSLESAIANWNHYIGGISHERKI